MSEDLYTVFDNGYEKFEGFLLGKIENRYLVVFLSIDRDARGEDSDDVQGEGLFEFREGVTVKEVVREGLRKKY